MSIFEGAGVALVTPFHEDGSVNFEKLTVLLHVVRLVRQQL